jgi:hypothetical protein
MGKIAYGWLSLNARLFEACANAADRLAFKTPLGMELCSYHFANYTHSDDLTCRVHMSDLKCQLCEAS